MVGGIEQISKLLKGSLTFRANCRAASQTEVLRHWGRVALGGTGGKRTTETSSGFCWGLGYGLINIPVAAAVKVSFVCILWQRMLSVTKFIDCLSI